MYATRIANRNGSATARNRYTTRTQNSAKPHSFANRRSHATVRVPRGGGAGDPVGRVDGAGWLPDDDRSSGGSLAPAISSSGHAVPGVDDEAAGADPDDCAEDPGAAGAGPAPDRALVSSGAMVEG